MVEVERRAARASVLKDYINVKVDRNRMDLGFCPFSPTAVIPVTITIVVFRFAMASGH